MLSWLLKTTFNIQESIVPKVCFGAPHFNSVLQLYLTFVRPHLEDVAPGCVPHQLGLSDSLESVQKFALRMSMRDWNIIASYATLLESCNLPTLYQAEGAA